MSHARAATFSLHGTCVFWLGLWWALVGSMSQGESQFFRVHGTRCCFWHCYGSFYLAFALQHVPNIFNITPDSVPHAPIIVSASRWVPHPPLASERRDPQRPMTMRCPGSSLPFFVPSCPRTHALSASPPIPPCPVMGKPFKGHTDRKSPLL